MEMGEVMKNIMYRKKSLLVFLTGALIVGSLTACAGKKDKKADDGKEKSKVKVEEGTLEEDSVVITVGSETVTYAQMLVYAYILRDMYNSSYGSSLWSYQLDEETTLEDYAREELVSMVTQIKVIGQQAKKQDVILSNDERTEIKGRAEEFFEKVSEKNREKYCMTLEVVEKTFQENALATKMFYLATEEVDTDISDEEAKQTRIQYLQILTNGTDRNGTEISMDAKTKKEAAKRIKKLRAEAKTADSFYSFASENTDSREVEVTIGSNSEGYEQAFLDAAVSLEDGELSKVIEGENAYYIIYCVSSYDEDATMEKKEQIIAESENEMFQEKYAQWLSKYEVVISNSYWEQVAVNPKDGEQ